MEGTDLHHLIDLASDLQDVSWLMGRDRSRFIQLASRRLVDRLNPPKFAISDKGRGVLLYRYASPWTGQD